MTVQESPEERLLADTGRMDELLDRRRRAAIVAAKSGDSPCHCSACEILRGEWDNDLDDWLVDEDDDA